MNRIVIGTTGSRNATIDVDALLRGRMLLQANSGKGKSWLLRRLAEELFGKVQVIIIDPEGEFATLREKYGYVLVGKGGETPADPRSAALVAHKLLELRASAVCDLYEMKPFARHEWVRNFCDALIDAPKNLWHPCIIIVDEAHTFCPEKGAGESVAAESVIGLATRGRKRGYALILATQRLGKLRKDAAAELLNVLIGGTFIDIDRKRAADALGVYGKDQHEFFDQIKLLKRGLFFGLGPAISDERTLIEVGPVSTTHPEAGSAKHASEPPPAPEAVAKLLPQLSDLPKEAEAKAKTEAELRTEIRSLKAQLQSRPPETKEVKVADPKAIERAVAPLRDMLEEAVRILVKVNAVGFEGAALKADEVQKVMDATAKEIARIAKDGLQKQADEFEKLKRESNSLMARLSKMLERENLTVKVDVQRQEAFTVKTPAIRPPSLPVDGDGEISSSQMRVLRALAELDAIGQSPASKPTIAFWAEQRSTSGGYFNNLGKLRSLGLIEYPNPRSAQLTDAGREKIGSVTAPDSEEVIRRVQSLLSASQVRILDVLRERYPAPITKDELAERSGQKSTSGGYFNNLGAMRTAGLLDYPQPGAVKASDWLFIQ